MRDFFFVLLFGQEMDSFAKQALDTHNKHRALHQVLPLTYSSSLAKDAQAWAEKIAREGKMKHAENCSDGENIFFASGKSEYGGNEPVERWYSEVEKYDFKKGGWQSGAGHFTQVVWKDSRELGIGKAVGSNGAIYVVGRYRPAGNNLRHFADNVFPAKVKTHSQEFQHSNRPSVYKSDQFPIPPAAFSEILHHTV